MGTKLYAYTLGYVNSVGGKAYISIGDALGHIWQNGKRVATNYFVDTKAEGFGVPTPKMRDYVALMDRVEQARKEGIEYSLTPADEALKEYVKLNTLKPLYQRGLALEQYDGLGLAYAVKTDADVALYTRFVRHAVLDPGVRHVKPPTAPDIPVGVNWSFEDWLSEKIVIGRFVEAADKRLDLDATLRKFVKKYDGQGNLVDLVWEDVPTDSVLRPLTGGADDRALIELCEQIAEANPPVNPYQLIDGQPESSPNATTTGTPLQLTDLASLFTQAKAFWLQRGALASVLHDVSFSIGELPDQAVAQVQGNHILFSPDAAGFGWFIDPTPAQHEEFTQIGSSQEYLAQRGSAADGRIDLLGVMIHELGHALGLEHSDDGHDEMAATATPGLRRLPDVEEGEFAFGLGTIVTAGLRTSQTIVATAPQYEIAANPQLENPAFADNGSGWSTTGTVGFSNGAAVLSETAASQTRLNQVFVLGEGARFLSFTLANTHLGDQTEGPDDAFEVALLDANTGLSLLGTTGLSHNDAILNLQAAVQGSTNAAGAGSAGAAYGTEHKASGISRIDNADGSRTYLIDLAGIPAGTTLNLAFDLIGFGRGGEASNSQLTIRDLRIGVPQARDDSATLAEDSPSVIDALANDLNAHQPGFVPEVVTGSAHGQVSITADGGFRFTPDKDWNGQDSFSYKLSDGRVDSNVATVTLTTAEDTVLTGNLLSSAADIDSTIRQAGIVTGPQHGQVTLADDWE